MHIHFIRHGESEHNKTGMITGWANPSLTDDGMKQIESIKEGIPKNIKEIWCADFLRHRQACEIINKDRQLPVIYDERLRERDFGSLEGKFWEDLENSTFIIEQDRNQKYDYRPFGGESVEDVKERLLSAIEDMKKSGKDEILVVTSAGIIRLLYFVQSEEIKGKIDNGSVHTFDFSTD